MQHTPRKCQGNITSPNCCRSPLPLPSCRANHVLTRDEIDTGSKMIRKRCRIRTKNARCVREDVPSQQCRSWRHFHGRNLKRTFAKFCFDYAGPLTTKITQRLSAQKNICAFLLALQAERYRFPECVQPNGSY